MTTGRPVRVLVVDDSVVVRRLVTDVLSADPGIEVVGTAVNGRVGLAKIEQLEPDLVTLDIEMPELDGLATLRALRIDRPRLPVIMFSTLTAPGAAVALEALAAGASDYVTKPANVGSVAESIANVRDQLIPRVHALAGRGAAVRRGPGSPLVARVPVVPRPVVAAGRPKVLAIGCSTGGPQALASVLQALPASFPLPVVVVQHMPPVFTAQFAARLDRTCALTVREAAGGERLQPGWVYIAPGNFHMQVVPGPAAVPVLRLDQEQPVCYCRPAVDKLFTSVAGVYGSGTLAVVLTGMGHDGRDGAGLIRAAHGSVLVQDEASSVVWGMPGAIAIAGLADAVLPLDSIAGAIMSRAAQNLAVSR